jgi:hypothetical protein
MRICGRVYEKMGMFGMIIAWYAPGGLSLSLHVPCSTHSRVHAQALGKSFTQACNEFGQKFHKCFLKSVSASVTLWCKGSSTAPL